jgi:hypothetical protein
MEEPEYNFITYDVTGGTRVEAWYAKGQARVPFTMALDLLAMRDLEFLTAFLQALRSSAYKAYLFETPPMTFMTVSPLIPKINSNLLKHQLDENTFRVFNAPAISDYKKQRIKIN